MVEIESEYCNEDQYSFFMNYYMTRERGRESERVCERVRCQHDESSEWKSSYNGVG